ncbi:MAG: carbohydrate kinase family protein [Cyclobacteriaceae bacterium]
MQREFDVIVVGELNVDLILNELSCHPVVGTETLADQMKLTLGSSSAICASNLSSLGVKVAFIGKVGDDIFGQFIIDQLNNKGVNTSMIIVDDRLETGASVALCFDEDRAMITHQGAMEHLLVDDITDEMLKRAKHLHFSSYFLQSGFRGTLELLFQKARRLGLTTSLDVQWDPSEKWDLDLSATLHYVDIFLPNESELRNLTGESDLNLAIDKIQMSNGYLVVKCGNRGSILCYEDKRIKKEPFLNKYVVDAIGAGDSFNAGFICKFLNGDSPEESQVFGNLTGAISTTQAGGTGAFTSYEEVMKVAREQFNFIEE